MDQGQGIWKLVWRRSKETESR